MNNNYGYIRTACATPSVKIADVDYNKNQIIELIKEARKKDVSVLTFPELSITGYSCGDLFGQSILHIQAEKAITDIKKASRGSNMIIIVGTPVPYIGRLYNCAVVIKNGTVLGIVPKIYLPSYGEFYEARQFASGADFLSKKGCGDGQFIDNGEDFVKEDMLSVITYAGSKCNISPRLLFKTKNATIGIEICEDLWTPIPPSSYLTLAGADIITNLSSSNELVGKNQYRKSLISQLSTRTICGYLYCSSGDGESTQDTVYAGSTLIYENGKLLAEKERFTFGNSLIVADIDVETLRNERRKQNTYLSMAPDGTRSGEYGNYFFTPDAGNNVATDFEADLYRSVDKHPFIPYELPKEYTQLDSKDFENKININKNDDPYQEILNIQAIGLANRLRHINCKNVVIGISGGLDSTLALLATVLAFDKLGLSREGIHAITMPGFGTSKRTKTNADKLMDALGVTSLEIPIGEAVKQHLKDIQHDIENRNVVYENSQARERTQILMDYANKVNGIVIGTGDLSELALGWCTYNGDHMSMYSLNSGIAKTLVINIVIWAANTIFTEVRDVLLNIADTPISPELTPADEKGEIAQKTEELIGAYELHDFFLYNMFRFGYSPKKLYFLTKKAFEGQYSNETILNSLTIFMKRFFGQQFKRSCLPDGPKIGSVSLSPRGDWRMPSDTSANLFLNELKNIEGII